MPIRSSRNLYTTMAELGDRVQIDISVDDVGVSLPFYEKLGFEVLRRDTNPYPWAQLTDGFHNFLLHEDWFSGLGYFATDAEDRLGSLRSGGVPISTPKMEIGDGYGVITDPNGFTICLVTYDPSNEPAPPGEPVSRCGTFGEISILTADVQGSIDFWKKLGFGASYLHPDASWATVQDGLITVGLYTRRACPHYFEKPAITYFASDMPQRLSTLRDAGIPFIEQIVDRNGRIADGITLAPDGQCFFLFSG